MHLESSVRDGRQCVLSNKRNSIIKLMIVSNREKVIILELLTWVLIRRRITSAKVLGEGGEPRVRANSTSREGFSNVRMRVAQREGRSRRKRKNRGGGC